MLTAVTHRMANLAGPLPPMAMLVALESVAASALGLAVGAGAPSLDFGLEMAKALMTISTVFGGLYFDARTLPWALRWVPQTSLVRLTWDGLIAHEMSAIGALGLRGLPHTAELAQEHGVSLAAADESARQLAAITLLLYTLAFASLAARAPRFYQLRSGGEQDAAKAKRA